MNSIQMTIQQALTQGYRLLESHSPDHRIDTQVLLCHTLNCNFAKLMAWPELSLTADQELQFEQLIDRRRQGIPVAYLTGYREFWSMNFNVTPDTLIPRPETELLVETVLAYADNSQSLELADLGTGSGAIACAIASERQKWKITATDISVPALEIAQQNAINHHLTNIQFINSNWFEALSDKHFDIITSNPPYIASNDKHLNQGDVRFEPDCALSAGPDGMDDIEYLCLHARQHLNIGGLLLLEHGYDQQQAVKKCLQKNNYNTIFHKKDLAGHIRVSGAYA